ALMRAMPSAMMLPDVQVPAQPQRRLRKLSIMAVPPARGSPLDGTSSRRGRGHHAWRRPRPRLLGAAAARPCATAARDQADILRADVEHEKRVTVSWPVLSITSG